jgi:hypothetical protein
MNWPTAFALTAAIELPIVAAVAPRALRKRAALDSLAANLLTHPLAWYLFAADLLPWVAIEVSVTVLELAVYRFVTRMPWARAAFAALLANGVTAALSFVVA